MRISCNNKEDGQFGMVFVSIGKKALKSIRKKRRNLRKRSKTNTEDLNSKAKAMAY